MPATLSLHAVRNSIEATASGCKLYLAPGYEVLGTSDISDDLPMATFEVPDGDENRPVFIVPSAAKGEEGPFTLVVEGSGPVDVLEVEDEYRNIFHFSDDRHVEWSDKMPYRKNRGGGRFKKSAPCLTWYRNPQYRVRLKSRVQAATEENERSAGDVERGAPAAPDFGALSAHGDSTDAPEFTALAVKAPETHTLHVEVLGASDFSYADWLVDEEIHVSCGVEGAATDDPRGDLFRTEAVTGTETPTWDHTQICRGIHTGENLVFRCCYGSELLGQVTLPYDKIAEGFDGELDLAVEGQAAWGKLSMNVHLIEAKKSAGSQRSKGSVSSGHGSKSGEQAAKLQVLMLPTDPTQKVACAIHICKNLPHEDQRFYGDDRINENPYYHHVIASSAVDKHEYQVASEIGAVCKLHHGATEEDDGESVFIIPSLERREDHGKFSLQILATEDIIVERVN